VFGENCTIIGVFLFKLYYNVIDGWTYYLVITSFSRADVQ